jgi:tetraacyldisaccharide 4'-kinase
MRLFAAAGIASPQRFLATLAALGADTVGHRFFPDHHPFTADELERILEEARNESLSVVMTGKDAVKVPARLAARVYVVEIDIECVRGSFIDVLRPVLGTAGLESLS